MLQIILNTAEDVGLLYTIVTDLDARSEHAVHETEGSLGGFHEFDETALKPGKKTQHREHLYSRREEGHELVEVRHEVLEFWIILLESTAKHHVHDDVCNTRRNQLFRVERLAMFLSHFADHLFHFHCDPRFHRVLTEPEPRQDRQAELVVATKLGVVVSV